MALPSPEEVLAYQIQENQACSHQAVGTMGAGGAAAGALLGSVLYQAGRAVNARLAVNQTY